jgi:hypothetical protein
MHSHILPYPYPVSSNDKAFVIIATKDRLDDILRAADILRSVDAQCGRTP